MKKFALTSLGVLFFLVVIGSCLANFRSLSYENVREEGGFNAETLKDVIEIFPKGRNLNLLEIRDLTQSTSLRNLKILDFTDHAEINDAVIEELVNNGTFSKITTLKLSGTSITDTSITHILNSKLLGSVRDLPQISGRYGIPSSVITVHTKDTEVKDKKQKTLFDFHIEYRPLNFGITWEPVEHGVKIVEVENF